MDLRPGDEKPWDRASTANSSEEDVGFITEDLEYEKRLVRKLDLNIIPLVMALYLFSFLDR